ncbi:MAG TPA: hypothetical protein VIJ86_12525 [Acidimicrobiales bacterium]
MVLSAFLGCPCTGLVKISRHQRLSAPQLIASRAGTAITVLVDAASNPLTVVPGNLVDPEVEMTPSPGGVVVVSGGRNAARTLVDTLSPADPHHHPFGGERHARNNDAVDGDNAIKCSGGAHVVPPIWVV